MSSIIIIGAGIAGLAAGQTLQKAGHPPLILEARTRPGGRTYTDTSLGVPIDLGAAWIHGPHGNPLTPLAQKFGLGMSYTDFTNERGHSFLAFTAAGEIINPAEFAQGMYLYRGAISQISGSLLYTPPPGRTLAELVATGLPCDPTQLPPAGQHGFTYASQIRPQYEDAADLNQIDWRLSAAYHHLPGGELLLHGGGYNRLVEGLTAGLEIQLSQPVTQIVVHKKGVDVRTATQSWGAEKVIITVPLGVLKSGQIQFRPELPAAKREAIQRLGWGQYEKIALRFPHVFWPTEPQWFVYLNAENPPLGQVWVNMAHYTGEPILVAYHSGSRAIFANQLSDDLLTGRCVTILRRLFGPAVPEPVQIVRSNWQVDPFAQGSYSFGQVGQGENDREILARPVENRLFFAGEAIHPHYWGTVHGAYESGVWAAGQVLAP